MRRTVTAVMALVLAALMAGCGPASGLGSTTSASSAQNAVAAPSVVLGHLHEPAAAIPGMFAVAGPTEDEPTPATDLAPHAAAAVLMDASSGQVLWAKNANLRRPAASVTKLMTMAVVLDGIASGRIKWHDLVSASEEAVRTPGSQIWLELGENMTAKDLFYAVAVQSANDAAVALGEYVGGTMAHFLQMMNAKARALGMRDTRYTDANGLEDTQQYTSAYDIALLSRYLVVDRPQVLKYTATWEYRLRDNKLWLVNRNRLLTMMTGVDGLKTGFTPLAGYCLSGTAMQGTTRLIAVVLGEPSSALRFSETAAMLRWGFTHYTTVPVATARKVVAKLPVDGGVAHTVTIVPVRAFGVTVPRGKEKTVTTQTVLPRTLSAPVARGQKVGEITVTVEGKPVAVVALVAGRAVPRISGFRLWLRLWAGMWPWLRT